MDLDGHSGQPELPAVADAAAPVNANAATSVNSVRRTAGPPVPSLAEAAFAGLLTKGVQALTAGSRLGRSGQPLIEHGAHPAVALEYVPVDLPSASLDAAPDRPAQKLAELLPHEGALGDYLAPLPPGEPLATLLAAIDLDKVDDYSLVEVVAAHKRMESWAAAQAAKAAAVLAERPALNPSWPGDQRGRTRGECLAGHELAMRLKISKLAATRLAAMGRAFSGLLEGTGEALELGLIDVPRAQAIFTTLDGLPPEVAISAQWEVLDTAPGRTLRQVHQDLAKAVIAVDPDDADARHRAARQKRRVYRPRPLPDGMASISAVLTAADAIALDTALDAAARAAKHSGDGRTLDQLRADSLALMGHTALVLGHIGPHPAAHCTCGCTARSGAEPAGETSGHGSQQGASLPGASGPEQPRDRPPPPEQGPAPPPHHAQLAKEPPPSEQPPDRPSPPATPHDVVPPKEPPPSEQPPDRPPPPATPHDVAPTPAPAGSEPPHPGHRLSGGQLPVVRLGSLGGIRADVRITVPLSVALPDLHAPPRHALERDPEPVAEIEGYGPVSPEVARALAAGGVWRRLITDPVTEEVLHVGRSQYKPPAGMAALVRERDRTCVLPACSTPARSCDLDHMHEWHDGGETSVWNLEAMCRADHPIKTIGALTVARASDGTYAWTTPTGHGYLRRRDGTVIPLPRRSAAELRAIGKKLRRSGRSVDPEVVDAVLAEVAAGSGVTGTWTPPALPGRSGPVRTERGDGPAWGWDEDPPF